jgi:hypothetical protein
MIKKNIDYSQYTQIVFRYSLNKVKRFTNTILNDYLYSFYNKITNQSKKKESFYGYEYIPPKLLKWILRNEKKVKKALKDNKNDSNNLFNVLDVIQKTQIKGFIKVLYNKTDCGRYYALNNISLQNMWRQIRQLLSYLLYYDVDIVNCHATIMANVCKKNNIKCSAIIDYRDNREKHIKQLLKNNKNKTRDEIKTAIISILNGGERDYKKLNKTPFLIKLFNEYNQIVEIIIDINKKIFNKCLKLNQNKNENNKKYNNKHNTKREVLNEKQLYKKTKRTTVSYFLMTKENEIMQYMIKYFKENKIIKNDLYVCIYDGFQIDRGLHSKEYINTLLRKLEDNISHDLKIDIKLKVKDFNDCKELLKITPKKYIKKRIPIETLNHLIKNNEFNKKINNFAMSNRNEIDFDIHYHNHKINGIYRIPNFEKHIENNDTLHIKSNMGSGKTYQLYEYIKKIMKPPIIPYSYIKQPKILFVGFRKTLEKKYMKDFKDKKLKFEYYLDILKDKENKGKIDAEKHPYLIIQINSLYKIIGTYDIIIFDEISYTLDTFLSFCEERQRVFNTLNELCDEAQKVITMDAFLSKRDIEFINNIRKEKKTCTLLNTSDDIKGYIKFYEKKTFTVELIEKLNNNKKIVLATNSKTYLENIEGLLKENNITYLFITSNSKEMETCDNWDQFNLIAYTPTVTAGISFEKDHFDYRFAYFSNRSAPASICCQQLFRVRITTDKDLYICINDGGKKDYPETRIDIIKYMNDYLNSEFKFNLNLDIQKNTCELFENGLIRLKKGRREYKQNDYFKVVLGYLEKVYKSANNLQNEILYYLHIQGYVNKNNYIFDGVKEDIYDDVFKDIIKDYQELKVIDDAQLYKNTLCPQTSEYKKLKEKERKGKIDKVKIHLYELLELEKNITDKEPKEIKKIIKNLQNLRFDYNLNKEKNKDNKLTTRNYIKYNVIKNLEKSNDIIDNDFSDYAFDQFNDEYKNAFKEDNINSHDQKSRDYWLKCLTASELIKVLGFKNSDDFETKIKFDYTTLHKVYIYVNHKWSIFDHLFKCGDMWQYESSYKKRFMSFLNTKLNFLNRELKTKRIKKNGKCYYNYFIDILIKNDK